MSATLGPGPGSIDTRMPIGGASKLVQMTPVYSFGGSGVVRETPTSSGQQAPAPDLYDHTIALGVQKLSRCRTAPQFSAGHSTRAQQAKVYQGRPTQDTVLSPGPARYERVTRPGTLLGEGSPAYSFGEGDEVEGKGNQGSRVPLESAIRPPGPGQYNADSALGKQTQSAQAAIRRIHHGSRR